MTDGRGQQKEKKAGRGQAPPSSRRRIGAEPHQVREVILGLSPPCSPAWGVGRGTPSSPRSRTGSGRSPPLGPGVQGVPKTVSGSDAGVLGALGLRPCRGGPRGTPRTGFQLLTIVSGAKPPMDDRRQRTGDGEESGPGRSPSDFTKTDRGGAPPSSRNHSWPLSSGRSPPCSRARGAGRGTPSSPRSRTGSGRSPPLDPGVQGVPKTVSGSDAGILGASARRVSSC